MRIGYVVGYTVDREFDLDYDGVKAKVSPMSVPFILLSDAQIVLAAERLKSPNLQWEVYELHDLSTTER